MPSEARPSVRQKYPEDTNTVIFGHSRPRFPTHKTNGIRNCLHANCIYKMQMLKIVLPPIDAFCVLHSFDTDFNVNEKSIKCAYRLSD